VALGSLIVTSRGEIGHVPVSPSRTAVVIRRSGEVPALPYSTKLHGSLHAVRWPNVCIACGAVSAERVPVTRVFDRDWRFTPVTRSPDEFRIITVQTVHAPVCAACASRHHREALPIGTLRAVLSGLATAWTVPLLIAVLPVLLYVFPELLGEPMPILPATRTIGQAAVFALVAAAFGLTAWYQTRPRRVTPPTSVTAAFDFSDNLAGIGRPQRRVYGMENGVFAQAFRAANADRVVDSDSPASRHGR
jgi:hypothetical protein